MNTWLKPTVIVLTLAVAVPAFGLCWQIGEGTISLNDMKCNEMSCASIRSFDYPGCPNGQGPWENNRDCIFSSSSTTPFNRCGVAEGKKCKQYLDAPHNSCTGYCRWEPVLVCIPQFHRCEPEE